MTNQPPDGRTGLRQCGLVLAVFIELGPHRIAELVGGDELPVGRGRGGKAVGHPDPLALQSADQLSQGGVLAADAGHVPAGQLGEPEGPFVFGHDRPPIDLQRNERAFMFISNSRKGEVNWRQVHIRSSIRQEVASLLQI